MLISSIITICLLICVQSQYITLPPLPYNYDALEPILSEKIMRLHHLKHHQTYTTKVNTAIESIINETTDKDLIKLMKSDINTILTNLNQIPQPYRQTLRNNGGGYINHKLFWHLMTKPTYINETIIEPQPDGILLNEINNKFQSFTKFKEQFTNNAINLFGSGWTWLMVNVSTKELAINSTANQDSLIMENKYHVPILGIDVWEHAYYLTYENRRNEYVDNWFKIINWPYVQELYMDAIGQHIDL
ncbi:unnamed protein product [Didymodactylos carnosus]|uniref:Superoxide dismutase n=2 Tax=Didymodactylos carnosus TaxID=1234261 RepID=A0A813Z967_9BILA|nr:unnamed protein product [Didymodactylos carnosus]CAF3679841.1 unnamed protein product [Didymodactylos carnosus]